MNRHTQTLERLLPFIERARKFSGWDFANLDVRELEAGPPWDYAELARDAGHRASAVLDMGTGGGEFIAKIRDSLPHRVIVTEQWEVNAPIAKHRLAPLGVEVARCKSRELPFADESFDLVLNRHEELDPADVARVLKRGGKVITQQVGRQNWHELRRYFPRKVDFGDLRGEYARGFEGAGLRVARDEQHEYRVAFASLGEIVFMLLIAPWEIPHFDVEKDIDGLLQLEAAQLTERGLELTESRFLLVAEKPKFLL